MAYKYGRDLSGKEISHDTATYAGGRTHEENENEVVPISHSHGYGSTADRKDPQPDGIRNIDGLRYDAPGNLIVHLCTPSPNLRPYEKDDAGHYSDRKSVV